MGNLESYGKFLGSTPILCEGAPQHDYLVSTDAGSIWEVLLELMVAPHDTDSIRVFVKDPYEEGGELVYDTTEFDIIVSMTNHWQEFQKTMARVQNVLSARTFDGSYNRPEMMQALKELAVLPLTDGVSWQHLQDYLLAADKNRAYAYLSWLFLRAISRNLTQELFYHLASVMALQHQQHPWWFIFSGLVNRLPLIVRWDPTDREAEELADVYRHTKHGRLFEITPVRPFEQTLLVGAQPLVTQSEQA